MMIGHVLKTFLDFLAVFAIYVIAFGTTFSMILGNKAMFLTNVQSYISTSVMMTGEMNLELIYQHYLDNKSYESMLNNHLASKFVYVLFLILMAVVINNLLVGLAVDDIDSIRETAEANRIALMIDDTLRYEFQGSRKIRKYWVRFFTCCGLRTKKSNSLSFDKMNVEDMVKKYDGQNWIVRYFMRDRIVPPKEFERAARDWRNYQPQLQAAIDARVSHRQRR